MASRRAPALPCRHPLEPVPEGELFVLEVCVGQRRKRRFLRRRRTLARKLQQRLARLAPADFSKRRNSRLSHLVIRVREYSHEIWDSALITQRPEGRCRLVSDFRFFVAELSKQKGQPTRLATTSHSVHRRHFQPTNAALICLADRLAHPGSVVRPNRLDRPRPHFVDLARPSDHLSKPRLDGLEMALSQPPFLRTKHKTPKRERGLR